MRKTAKLTRHNDAGYNLLTIDIDQSCYSIDLTNKTGSIFEIIEQYLIDLNMAHNVVSINRGVIKYNANQ